jgi:MFS family permease
VSALRARLRPGSLWGNADFTRLWGAQTVSLFGSLVTRTALPFAAILALDATPFQVALLGAADLAPGVLVGLVAGAWVDRLRRRPIMIAADVGRAALLGSIPLASLLDALSLGQLYLVAFLVGILTTFFDVAYLSYLPTLIERDDLLEGNSKLAASASVAEVGSFGLAGWLVQIFTAPLAILIDAFSFVVSALLLLRIRTPERAAERPAGDPEIWREIVEGLRAMLQDGLIRWLAAGAIALDLAFRVSGAVFLIFATRELGFRPGVLGMIFAVGGVSSFFGAVLASRVGGRIGMGRAMLLGLVLTAAGQLLVPLAQSASLLAAGLLIAQQLIGDGGATLFIVNEVSLRQAVAPPAIMGRINAGIHFLGLIAMLAGTFLGGLIGENVGLRATLVFGAAIPLLAGIAYAFSPIRHIRAVPPSTSGSPTALELSG